MATEQAGRGYDTTETLLHEYVRTRAPHLRREIIERQQALVRSVASKFVRSGVAVEDLIQCGWVALIRAVDRYEPSHDTRFTTYAVHCMVGEIKRYFRDHTWGIKVPRRLQEIAVRLERIQERLRASLVREPSVPEMAEAAGVSPEDLARAIELRQLYHLHTLDERTTTPDGKPGERVGDTLGEMDWELEGVLQRVSAEQLLELLHTRERQIVRRRFLEGRTQQQVAAEMGLSQMHISRLERKALGQLREAWSEGLPAVSDRSRPGAREGLPVRPA